MKEITHEEWDSKFEILSTLDLEWDDAAAESLTFFDNGAAQNSEGDFIVKCDMVKRRTV